MFQMLIIVMQFFNRFSSLSDIKSLEKWNVSNFNYFSFIFKKCSSLSDIKTFENLNISNVNNCEAGCSSLSDIKELENWNVLWMFFII